jgi:serine/threonine protein kinase/tetratricopeptide (TPR) repeat protein
MTAEEWERIKSIFDAALQIPLSERAAWLDAACAGRPDLKKTVEQLLTNIADAGSFLEDDSRVAFREPAFTTNQLIAGRFRVIRLIAAGGMGEVYEVFDDRLDLRVALKTIRSDLVASRDAYERFKREVWVTRDVAHDGICRVFELVEHRDPEDPHAAVTPCITMKLLDGHDLQSELRLRRPLPLEEALSIAKQICEALQALHNHDIIHRDLKPSNIMLVPGRKGAARVVLTDFGLARPVDQTTLTRSATGNDQPGAPYFQAPEILKGERESIASDIYALGLVLDELVTKSRAFTADSVHGLYWQKIWEKPIPPSQRSDDLPVEWEQVILKCLATAPADRFARALDVIAALESLPVECQDPAFVTPVLQTLVAQPTASAPAKPTFTQFLRRRGVIASGLLLPILGAITVLPAILSSRPPATIAVFPVLNNTSPEHDYLTKGISAELLRRLGGVHDLHVYPIYDARSAMTGKQGEAVQFHLRTQLERWTGGVRLSAQLTDHATGASLWSKYFNANLSDAVRLESEVAEGVVSAVEDQITQRAGLTRTAINAIPFMDSAVRAFTSARFRLPSPATVNSPAFHAYTRGRFLWEERTVRSALQAMICFEQAVKMDPNFALAWAAMADAQRVLMEFDHGSREETLQRAREYAERAVSLNPSLPEAQATLGAVAQVAWEWDQSERAYKRAIDLNPRFARGHRWYGGLLLQLGKVEEALERTRLALELDPWDYPAHAAYGFCLFSAGKPLEAVQELERTLAEKDLISAHINLGLTYAALAGTGQKQEAQSYFEKAKRQAEIVREKEIRGKDPSKTGDPVKYADLISALAYAYFGEHAIARTWLERLEQGRLAGRTSSVTVASVHAVLKDTDRALDLLEMAAAYHERELTNLKISPFFAALHGHPRFEQLLKRIGLSL